MGKTILLVLGTAIAVIVFGGGSTAPVRAQSSPSDRSTQPAPLGFDMWCLEMELLPQDRCDARKAEDLKSFEQYRSRTERFQQERDAKARREQELRLQLQRDPINNNRMEPNTAP